MIEEIQIEIVQPVLQLEFANNPFEPSGAMSKLQYDVNDNGIVDDSERLGGELPQFYASDAEFAAHIADFNNPHNTSAGQVPFSDSSPSDPLVSMDVDAALKEVHQKVKAEAINRSNADATEVTNRNSAIAAAVVALKDGVPVPGDSLQKLYNLILSSFTEVTVANIAARNALDVTAGNHVFVTDDGDGNWALYKATTSGINATYVKLSDPDLLNAVMSNSQIKVAYESNADTNALTNALLSKLNAIQAGATANSPDAQLRDRATHTGTQLASTVSDFASTVLATVLAGLSTATNAVITASDSVLSALGKLQKQISDNLTTLTSHTSNTSNPHSVTKAQVTLGNVDNVSVAAILGFFNIWWKGGIRMQGGTVAGTYMAGAQQNVTGLTSGVNLTVPPNILNIDTTDFPTINGLTARLKIRATIATNATAPTGTFRWAMFAVTAGGGAAGGVSYIIGAEVAGSTTSTLSAPGATTITGIVGSEFVVPTTGMYVVSMVKTGTSAANNETHSVVEVQMKYS